jgi:DnaK suppressor protein
MRFTKTELEKFKNRLEELRTQHSLALKGTSQEVKSPDEARGVSQHHADGGTDDFGRTISIEVSSREMGVLRQIERAMAKIEEGTYGVCDISGEDIPMKRLEAIPYAIMTVGSQDKLEKGLFA